MRLADLDGMGEAKLIVADVIEMKLKVYQNAKLQAQVPHEEVRGRHGQVQGFVRTCQLVVLSTVRNFIMGAAQ